MLFGTTIEVRHCGLDGNGASLCAHIFDDIKLHVRERDLCDMSPVSGIQITETYGHYVFRGVEPRMAAWCISSGGRWSKHHHGWRFKKRRLPCLSDLVLSYQTALYAS